MTKHVKSEPKLDRLTIAVSSGERRVIKSLADRLGVSEGAALRLAAMRYASDLASQDLIKLGEELPIDGWPVLLEAV